MKEGWEYSTIGKLCKTYSGGTPLKNVKEYYQDGNIPWLRSGEVCQKYIYETEMFITQKGLESSSAKYYPINTVVVAMYGATAAQVGILKIEATSNQAVCGIIPNSKFLPEFLYYFFCYRKEFLASQAQGGAQPNISQVKIKNLEVPVPSFSEQQSIVDYLDSAFAKIDAMKANAEKRLNEAKALFQASLKKMLEPKEGWEEKTLKETAKYRRGSFPQPYGNKEWYDGEGSMPFVQVAELQEDSFNLISVTKRRISKLAHPLSVFVPAGTVLVSLQGSIGKVAITNYDSYVDRTVAIFQDYKIEIDKTFFAYQLKSRFEIERLKARGTTIKTITKEEFANFSINCPPLSEQQSIVATLDSLKSKVDRLQANYEKISQECDALKQAILRQVFE